MKKNYLRAQTIKRNKEIIDKSPYRNIKLVGSRTSILYGFSKIHKETRNELPPFHPTLSADGTPTYKSKFLPKFLTPSTANEYTVINSSHFAEDICQQITYG